MAGWAVLVIGPIAVTDEGSVLVFGKRIGDMKGGHLRRATSERLSTMCDGLGQCNPEGYVSGAVWIY